MVHGLVVVVVVVVVVFVVVVIGRRGAGGRFRRPGHCLVGAVDPESAELRRPGRATNTPAPHHGRR